MRGHAAAGGQHAFGGVQAADVFRQGFGANKDHPHAVGGKGTRLLRIEDDLPRDRAGRGRKARGHHGALGIGIDGGMQQLVKRKRIDAKQRLLLAHGARLHEIRDDLQRGSSGALARPRREEPEPAMLNGEFDFNRVAEPRLECCYPLLQRRIGGGHQRLQGFATAIAERQDGAKPRGKVRPLRLRQEFPGHGGGPRLRMARPGAAHAAVVTGVAEDHHLHDEGKPCILGRTLDLALGLGAGRVPHARHGGECGQQLLAHVFLEGLAVVAFKLCLEAERDFLGVRAAEFGIGDVAALLLVEGENILEGGGVVAQHRVGIVLDEAAVALLGEAHVVALLGEGVRRHVVEADVEHRLHRTRHAGWNAGAHGQQKRTLCITELAARGGFELGQRLVDLRGKFRLHPLAQTTAGGDREHEARRHGQR